MAAAPRPRPAPVFLVGLRSWQHAAHSGYEGFRRHVGTHLRSPVRQRGTAGRWGWRVDYWVERALGRRDFTLPLLWTEVVIGVHMLGQALRRRRAVYHVLYGDSDYGLLGRFGRWTGHAVVASFHEGAFSFAWYGFDRRFFRHLSAVVLLSEAQRPFVAGLAPPERVRVVPLGVDPDFFRPPAATPAPRRGRVCITVGGHDRDVRTLGQAIALVRARDPGVRFVAVGTHVGNKGPYLRPDGTTADSAPDPDPPPAPGDAVALRSRLADDELLAAYHEASVAVFAFNWAGASTGVMEAMACGLPLVATDVGGVREYVGDQAGLLCPPNDPAALADAILRVLDEPALAERMGAAARRRALGYDYRVVARQLEEVYAASLERAGRAAAPERVARPA